MENNIRVLRRSLGLSQHRLGKKVGVSRITINYIENEKTIPSLSLADKIANALDTPLNKVFKLESDNDFILLAE